MDPLREIGKLLFVLGGVLLVFGALMFLGARLPFRFGRLPGDIVFQRRHGSFYFPIVTCIILSVLLSLFFWLVNFFRR